MNDKIENNPSHKKFKKQLEGAEALLKYGSLLGLDSDLLKKLEESVPEFAEKFTTLITSPDKFNDHFAKRGWICYSTMNIGLLTNCVDKADKDNIEEAENDLVNYYTSPQLRFWIGTLNIVPEFQVRKRFIEYAYEDTLNERYYAAVPVLLMLIDGVVNDIDKSKGFFAEGTDMTAWDSIAAHSSGLAVLKKLFSTSQNKTTTEYTTLPYRNGILHGRNLGYDNKITTAKCWLALLAVNEWARAVKEGKRKAPEAEKEPDLEEQIAELQKSFESYQIIKERNYRRIKLASEWKSRSLVIGVDVPKSGSSDGYNEFTPEKRAVEFVECWAKQNYGAIAHQIKRWTKEEISVKTEAGKIREIFEGKKLVSFEFLNIKDISPPITEVTLLVEFLFNNVNHKKEIKLRMMYQDSNGENMILGEPGGEWKYFPAFFNEIQFVD